MGRFQGTGVQKLRALRQDMDAVGWRRSWESSLADVGHSHGIVTCSRMVPIMPRNSETPLGTAACLCLNEKLQPKTQELRVFAATTQEIY